MRDFFAAYAKRRFGGGGTDDAFTSWADFTYNIVDGCKRFFFDADLELYLLRIRYDAATAVLGEAVGDAAGALALVAAHLGSSVRRCVGRAA